MCVATAWLFAMTISEETRTDGGAFKVRAGPQLGLSMRKAAKRPRSTSARSEEIAEPGLVEWAQGRRHEVVVFVCFQRGSSGTGGSPGGFVDFLLALRLLLLLFLSLVLLCL